MYPVNKPNQYNQPKPKENPFQLKHGNYFWMSRILGTFTKERFAEMQRTLEEMKRKAQENLEKEQLEETTMIP